MTCHVETWGETLSGSVPTSPYLKLLDWNGSYNTIYFHMRLCTILLSVFKWSIDQKTLVWLLNIFITFGPMLPFQFFLIVASMKNEHVTTRLQTVEYSVHYNAIDYQQSLHSNPCFQSRQLPFFEFSLYNSKNEIADSGTTKKSYKRRAIQVQITHWCIYNDWDTPSFCVSVVFEYTSFKNMTWQRTVCES